jgi:hypothetical protein
VSIVALLLAVLGAFSGGPQVPIGIDLLKVGPVLSAGPAGSWDGALVESPMVFQDGPLWRMVYVGYSGSPGAPEMPALGTAIARSPAGPWHDEGRFLDGPASGPFVWRDRGLYRLFYICLGAGGYEQGTKELCEATSPDFRAWTRLGPIVEPTGSGWASTAIWHPSLVERDGTYYLFFNANGDHESIGFATSRDLVRWTMQGQVLDRTTGWESAWVGDPFVYRIGSTWWMAYYGTDGSISQDGLAWTTDAAFPRGWQRWAGNPVLRVAGEQVAAKPAIVIDSGTYYHFYTAAHDDRRAIALAVAR